MKTFAATFVVSRSLTPTSGRIPSKHFGASSASVSGGRVEAGSRDGLFRRADNSDATADLAADRPAPVLAASVTAAASSLQSEQFDVDFSARANDSTVVGRSAGWSSEQGALYWLFDSDNPEALVKVLDGRAINSHWWFDLAVTSDLRSITRVTHRGTGEQWVAITGRGRDVFVDPGDRADRLVHCAFPASRADNTCAISGYGTTISLRDAWDSSGRIPPVHYD